ncbi:MAG: MarR family transcriptional regulator [Rhodospirillales bacterium]|nr:MarR family transcriptional regulator [Rhodospirillales bacterium]
MKRADGELLHGLLKTLYGAWKAVDEVDEAVHRSCGLSGSQSRSISHLIEGGPMTISDLAFERGVSRQSVQVAVSDLVERGFVRLEDNPRHKRAKLLHVTELGLSRFNAAQEAEFEILRKAFPDLDRDDVATAIRVLRMVRDDLSKQKESLPR